MKVAVIRSSTIAKHPWHRLDAEYWIRVKELCDKWGIDIDDSEKVQRFISAFYRQNGLGSLIDRATNWTGEKK